MPRPPRLNVTYSTTSADKLLAEVVRDYRIERPQACVFWEHGANDTYEVRCADARYSLRVYREGVYSREAIEFEVEALLYLHEQGVPVAYPIARRSGGHLTEIDAPEGTRFALLTAFAMGELPSFDSLDVCRRTGESVARMHTASDDFAPVHARARLDLQTLLFDAVEVIRPHLSRRPDEVRFLKRLTDDLGARVQAVPPSSLDIGFCHGDLHGHNAHVHDNTITHFDFEECGIGYRVYDLATFKWGVCTGDTGARRWQAFADGYDSLRTLGAGDAALVDTFVMIRELSNTACGIRNRADFGHSLVADGTLDDWCRHLKERSSEWIGTEPLVLPTATPPRSSVHDVRPFIGCRDFDCSRDFYVALGWEVTYDSDELRVMQLGDHRFYLQNYYQKEWCENTMLHVSVDDVVRWHAFVSEVFEARGLHEHGRLSGLPKEAGYGRVFHVWDPGGALIHFAEFADQSDEAR